MFAGENGAPTLAKPSPFRDRPAGIGVGPGVAPEGARMQVPPVGAARGTPAERMLRRKVRVAHVATVPPGRGPGCGSVLDCRSAPAVPTRTPDDLIGARPYEQEARAPPAPT